MWVWCVRQQLSPTSSSPWLIVCFFVVPVSRIKDANSFHIVSQPYPSINYSVEMHINNGTVFLLLSLVQLFWTHLPHRVCCCHEPHRPGNQHLASRSKCQAGVSSSSINLLTFRLGRVKLPLKHCEPLLDALFLAFIFYCKKKKMHT